MEYSNPKIPEGINTSKQSPLKEFAILSTGIIGTVFVLIFVIVTIIDNFADKIPFETEKSIAAHKLHPGKENIPVPAYLQSIVQKVVDNSDLPEGMDITVHYLNTNTVNAFATLGGHLFIFRGILERLSTEEEIAALIAHEVGHIKYRHPILSASHGIVISTALSLLNASLGAQSFDLLGSTSTLTLMHFSRDFENQADEHAISTIIKIYGNASGAVRLFNMFAKEADNQETFEMFSTHPLTSNRISRSQMYINDQDEAKATPVPGQFKEWLEKQKEINKTIKRQNLTE